MGCEDPEDDEEVLNEDFFDREASNEYEEVLNDNKPDKIVDEALNGDQMPPIVGDFAPYFKNVTEALMFCWIQKHNICKV